MPIFEFRCPRCGKVFERLCFRRDESFAPCPDCKDQKAERQLSSFSSRGSSLRGGLGSVSAGHSCSSHGGFS